MNKKRIFIISGTLVITIALIILIINLFGNDGLISITKNPDGEKFENEYEELNGVKTEDGKEYPEVNISYSKIIKYTNVDEIVNIFNNDKSAVIYFGFSTCTYCRSAIEVLCDTAKETELDTIYYFDVKENNNYDKLLNVLDERFITDENKIYAPLVLFISNGDIVSHNKGTLSSQDDPYVELDESQKQGLSEIYWYGIRDVVESSK